MFTTQTYMAGIVELHFVSLSVDMRATLVTAAELVLTAREM